MFDSLFGSHPQWIVYKRNGDQERMTNPVRQNEGHIKYLMQFLGQDPWASRVYNVVVVERQLNRRQNLLQNPQNSSIFYLFCKILYTLMGGYMCK